MARTFKPRYFDYLSIPSTESLLCTDCPQASGVDEARSRGAYFGGSAHSPRRTCAEPSQYAAGQVIHGWNQLWQEWGLLRTCAAATLSNYLSRSSRRPLPVTKKSEDPCQNSPCMTLGRPLLMNSPILRAVVSRSRSMARESSAAARVEKRSIVRFGSAVITVRIGLDRLCREGASHLLV
jgi:hypothetical protein